MPIFATFAYKNNVTIEVLLLFRFLIAAIFMNVYIFIKHYSYPKGKTLILLIFMGAIIYASQSFSYFSAVSLIGSSLTSILLYLYPGIVLLLSTFLLKIKVTKIELVALSLATMGAILVIGIKFENINTLGIMFAILAAIIYSIYIIVGSKAIKGTNIFVASTVIISSAAVVYTTYGLLAHISIPTTIEQWKWILAIVIISTITSVVTFFAGLKRIGPVKASMVSTFEPVVTLFFSFWLLQESINMYQIFGALLIIIAAVILAK